MNREGRHQTLLSLGEHRDPCKQQLAKCMTRHEKQELLFQDMRKQELLQEHGMRLGMTLAPGNGGRKGLAVTEKRALPGLGSCPGTHLQHV